LSNLKSQISDFKFQKSVDAFTSNIQTILSIYD
jgi:hypothetical protein